MADSIKEIGVKRPLLVRMQGDEVLVVDGECRLKATLLAISEGAEILTVPVMSEDRYATHQDRVVSMLICNDGLPLSLIAQGNGYKRLVAWGWSEVQIAKKIGKSDTHVKNALTIASASPEIIQLVDDGKVSATLALKQIQEKGEEDALKSLNSAVKTVEESGKKKATKKHIGQAPDPRKKKNWKKYGPKLYEILESLCTVKFGSDDMAREIARASELMQEIDDQR